ncbi:hypothetical protein N3K66_006992 [Trichothecium roseum]|uniref:Uncharacterized protein n=1 Tax=Trichothecium roseum TaxID=47278 RepID=A0ACC0UWY4_9HYPO|nr:hypothetical protein N3K66_006992 [Trichothecium roseum]
MPPTEETKAVISRKRTVDGAISDDSSSSSGSDSRASKKKRTQKKPAAAAAAASASAPATNGKSSQHKGALDERRNSSGKAARDPRDEAPARGNKLQQISKEVSIIEEDGLCRPTKGTRPRANETKEETDARIEKMSGAVRTILECLGEDPDREGLLDTPSRYAKALLFLTKGYQDNVDTITNSALFNENHSEMIIVKDIEIFSLCEHHMVPFTGKMHIGYIPNKTVIGLSKLPRIAEMFARRLQIQERLTKEVAHAIMEILKPQGVAVVMESSHLCMVMRGVEKTTTTTITSCVLGCFERKSKTRNEFLSLVGVNR